MNNLRDALPYRSPLHPELVESMVPTLRSVADRMEPEYAREMRRRTGSDWAGPLFLSADRATLREAADEIERLRAALSAVSPDPAGAPSCTPQ